MVPLRSQTGRISDTHEMRRRDLTTFGHHMGFHIPFRLHNGLI